MDLSSALICKLSRPFLSSRTFFRLYCPQASTLGVVGVSVFFAGAALPLEPNLPFLCLAVFGGLAAIFHSPSSRAVRSPIVSAVILFMLATGLSVLVSVDPGKSLRLSVAFLPAALVFFVIAEYCDAQDALRRLYLFFSFLSLGLAGMILWTATAQIGAAPKFWVSEVGSPLLLVPNDGTLLSILAPLSLVSLWREGTHRIGGMIATLALIASCCAVCMLQSRVALITMIITLTSAATLLRLRLGLSCGFVVLGVATLVDGWLGFPLLVKFGNILDTRISLWFVALSLFLEAPFLGHGVHTFGVLYRSHLERLQLPAWVPLDPHATVPWAHNLYLETLAEQGIIGLTALVFVLMCGLTIAWRLQRTMSGERRVFAVGAWAGLIGVCVAATVELTLMRQWVAYLLFTLLGVVSQLSSQLNFNHKEEDPWSQRTSG